MSRPRIRLALTNGGTALDAGMHVVLVCAVRWLLLLVHVWRRGAGAVLGHIQRSAACGCASRPCPAVREMGGAYRALGVRAVSPLRGVPAYSAKVVMYSDDLRFIIDIK